MSSLAPAHRHDIEFSGRADWKCEADRIHMGSRVLKVIGLISGTSFDATEAAAAELRLEDETVVLPPRVWETWPGWMPAWGRSSPRPPPGPQTSSAAGARISWSHTGRRYSIGSRRTGR